MTPSEFRQAREALGLTQSELARALKMTGRDSARTIRKWENGNPPPPGPAQVAIELLLEKM